MASRTIFEIDCGPEVHRIEIRDGKPHLLDHPDIDMLEAFTAFGAEPPECLLWVRRWKGAWYEQAALHGLTPPIGRYVDLDLNANLDHLPWSDRNALPTLAGTGTVTVVPGGYRVFAWPGPDEYMDDEREEWVSDQDLSKHFLALLKLAGDHGIGHVFLNNDGFTIPGLPVFPPTSGDDG